MPSSGAQLYRSGQRCVDSFWFCLFHVVRYWLGHPRTLARFVFDWLTNRARVRVDSFWFCLFHVVRYWLGHPRTLARFVFESKTNRARVRGCPSQYLTTWNKQNQKLSTHL